MKQVVSDDDLVVYHGDAVEVLEALPAGSVDAVVTSPPYLDMRPEYDGPKDYEYPLIFHELARVCTGGMLWNVGRMWRQGTEKLWWMELIRAASFSGWEHWDTGIWLKPNANPIHGRVLVDSHEYVLVFGRDGVRFNEDAIRTDYALSSIPRLKRKWIKGRGVKGDDRGDQQGRTHNELGARGRGFFVHYVGKRKGNKHPAPMPLEFAGDLVSLASWPGQTVLDPFAGSGTTGVAARMLDRRSVLVERDDAYVRMCVERMGQQQQPLFAG